MARANPAATTNKPKATQAKTVNEDLANLLSSGSGILDARTISGWVSRKPRAFLDDAMLPLLLLENSSLLIELYYDAQLAITSLKTVPPDVLHQLAYSKYADVRAAVASHANALAETRRMLAKDESYIVRRAIAVNIRTADDVLVDLADDVSEYVRTSVAPRLPTWLRQQYFALGSDETFRSFRTVDPNKISSDDLVRLIAESKARDGHWTLALAARHPNTPVHHLQEWAYDDATHYIILCGIAQHPHASDDTLCKLTYNATYQVRSCLLGRRLPDAAIELLLHEQKYYTDVTLADSPYLPPQYQLCLAERYAVASSSLSNYVIYHLARRQDLQEDAAKIILTYISSDELFTEDQKHLPKQIHKLLDKNPTAAPFLASFSAAFPSKSSKSSESSKANKASKPSKPSKTK